MDNLKEFERQVKQRRTAFFQFYHLVEELNQKYDLAKSYKGLMVAEIEQRFKSLPEASNHIKQFRSPERYETLIYQLAVAIRFFLVYGQGEVERAYTDLADQVRKQILEEEGGVK